MASHSVRTCVKILTSNHVRACICGPFAHFDYRTFAVQTQALDRFSLDGLVTCHYPSSAGPPCRNADSCRHGNGHSSQRLCISRCPWLCLLPVMIIILIIISVVLSIAKDIFVDVVAYYNYRFD